MSSEELLGTLEELADNVGNCLYDWDVEELNRLYEAAKKLAEAAREVADDITEMEEE